MKKATLIPFDRSHRLLDKVRGYLEDMESFLSDPESGIAILLEALPHADTPLLIKIIPLLGYAGKDRVLWPLYDLVVGGATDEQIRAAAAVQLGLAASLSRDVLSLNAALINMLDHSAPSIRIACALALGWEGNHPAVSALIHHFDDLDRDVQAAVVSAMVSVGDGYVFEFLTTRLQVGLMEEKRSILLHLWRFAEKFPDVESVYIENMGDIPMELRVDGLTGLGMLPLTTRIVDFYRRLLADREPRVRLQVLDNLLGCKADDYHLLKEEIRLLLNDGDLPVRQAAIRLYGRVKLQ
ncbi:hypothetical protein DSCOOX_36480 [Desulfosarcina ovata subsp. ovata]|uniref:PBS lyase n=1 Tax=Desulfosarcina ovata subsp. ovata TaxID=2752305 RepID=A0A5K8AD98_9BACT|nr:hypothetical protein DSCOOX_36480 [Desulfosarcina ovata subsp. ovata]